MPEKATQTKEDRGPLEDENKTRKQIPHPLALGQGRKISPAEDLTLSQWLDFTLVTSTTIGE